MSANCMRKTEISGILVGDELGQLKRIDLSSGTVRTINKHLIEDRPAPDKSILSIRGFQEQCLKPVDVEGDEGEDVCMEGKARAAVTNADPSVLLLVSQKPNQIYVYNSVTEKFISLKVEGLCNQSNLVGAAPFDRNNVVVCFENGNIFVINIEKELVQDCGSDVSKASKILGIDSSLEEELKRGQGQTACTDDKDTPADANADTRKDKKTKKEKKKKTEDPVFKPNPSFDYNPITQIFKPEWKRHYAVTCFEVSYGRLAIAGKNVDLKVFDLKNRECIFTAKPRNTGWMSNKPCSHVGDIAWLGPITSQTCAPISFSSKIHPSPQPCLVATCSKVDSLIRIYDIRSKRKKAIWVLNFKEERLKNEVIPPSFTCMTASPPPITCAVPTQQLILGTTMGRMIATELRFNSHSHRQLGVFKGFSGGTVRGISFVANVGKLTCHRIVSCSLDRFVRVHSFRTGSDPQRKLDAKFYIKTRPTCVLPILSNEIFIDDSCITDYNDLCMLDEVLYHMSPKLPLYHGDNNVHEVEDCMSGINVADFDEV